MKAHVITLFGDEYSEQCSARCVGSAAEHGLKVERFQASSPENVEAFMAALDLKWTYPTEGQETCPITGLTLRAYKTMDLRARYGCAMSHYRLWQACAQQTDVYLILEHDAVFLRPLPDVEFDGICMINDPRGATPHGGRWSRSMAKRGPGVWPKTRVMPEGVPDGLAGNSAYLLKPAAALQLVLTVLKLGVWPNDATMCIQLFPDLQELYPFVTRVHQTRSTTAH